MADINQLKVLGEEIRRWRLLKGIRTMKEMGEITGLSPQYLGKLENGHATSGGKPITPSDSVLERISSATGMPVEHMHMLLGRFSDEAGISPTAAKIAAQYDRLPPFARRIVEEAVAVAEAVAHDIQDQFTPRK